MKIDSSITSTRAFRQTKAVFGYNNTKRLFRGFPVDPSNFGIPLSTYIGDAFVFSETKQGHQFWWDKVLEATKHIK